MVMNMIKGKKNITAESSDFFLPLLFSFTLMRAYI